MGHDISAAHTFVRFEADESVWMHLTIFAEIVDLAFRSAFREYQTVSMLTRALCLGTHVCLGISGKSDMNDIGRICDKVNDTPCPRWLANCVCPKKINRGSKVSRAEI